MIIPAAALVLLVYISPQDSVRKSVSLAEISTSAVIYAEMAARDGGEDALLLGRMLELSGRFEEAALYYAMALEDVRDPETEAWLEQRRAGSTPLDTVLVLQARITNTGSSTARGLTLLMPLPESHPPYQEISILGGAFEVDSGFLVCPVESLGAGERRNLPVFVRVEQRPFTYRPISMPSGFPGLDELGGFLRQVEIPASFTGRGPCLDMSREVARLATQAGFEVEVVGGLVWRGDSLIFHAWDLLANGIPGMPLDPLLFKTDSLRAVGHCPTDVIPLWDLARGYELSVLYPSDQKGIEIGLRAFFLPFDPDSLGLPALMRFAAEPPGLRQGGL